MSARRGIRTVGHVATVVAVVVATCVVMAGTARAATLSYSGSFDGTQPTMPVVSISTPNCTSLGGTPVGYEVIPYTPLVSGDVSFELNSDGGTGAFVSLYVYENSFDPADGLTNCVAATNNGTPPSTPATLTYGATAGTPYFLVVFNDTFDQRPFGWTLDVETVPAVDMAVDITAGGPYPPGGLVPFTVEVTNVETDDADDAVVTVALPPEFDGSSIGDVVAAGDPAYACIPDAGAGTLTCTAAVHPVGDTAIITFTASLVDGLADGQEVEVTAEVDVASPTMVNTGDDIASAIVVIEVPAPSDTVPTPTTAPAATGVVVTPRFTG
jgi:hypothetical protein